MRRRIPSVQRRLAHASRPLRAIAPWIFYTVMVALAAAMLALSVNDDLEVFIYRARPLRSAPATPAPPVLARLAPAWGAAGLMR